MLFPDTAALAGFGSFAVGSSASFYSRRAAPSRSPGPMWTLLALDADYLSMYILQDYFPAFPADTPHIHNQLHSDERRIEIGARGMTLLATDKPN